MPSSQQGSTEEEPKAPHLGCGILGRNPIISVVAFAVAGVGIGIALSEWTTENEETKETVLKWVGLIGDLFIRALKAVVLPLVFVNVAISVVDMMMMGRASSVGVKTILLYATTTFIASTIGLISILTFQTFFKQGEFEGDRQALISLGCTQEGSLLTEMESDGSLVCMPNANKTSPFSQFEIIDLTADLATNSGGLANLSMSDSIYEGVFMKLITDNIFHEFVDGNFAAVIVFAIVFGVALGRGIFEKGQTSISANSIASFLKEIGEVLLTMINWIIACTPFAVLSLIANAIGSQNDLSSAFSNVGYLIAASLVGFFAHFLVTDIGFFYLASKGMNPIEYLKHIIPAQTTALACSSSAATLPVTLRCVKASGKVPDDIANFVCPLGSTINMDGSAIYFPCACIWLAVLNGIEPDVGSYILLIILSTVGSAGAAPVPSAGLVMVMTAYNTVFGTTGIPNGFEFIIAIDWFIDRLATALNVTGDSVVCAIVSARTPWEDNDTNFSKSTNKLQKEESTCADGEDPVPAVSTTSSYLPEEDDTKQLYTPAIGDMI